MKFLYYLAAIGNPNLNIKIDILKHNLIYINNNIQQNYDIIINNYNDNLNLHDIIDSFNLNFLDNIYIHNKKGILSELWFSNEYHSKINDYDFILFILDDVKILNIDIPKMIFIKSKYNIEFLSPKVLKATWEYMKHPKYKNLVLTNRVEIFCILLTPIDFKKFMDINDIENPYFWGLDYIISHFNIKTAIYHEHVVEHLIETEKNDLLFNVKVNQMSKYLKKYGYSSDKEIINKYRNEVLEIINEVNN